MPNQRDIPHRGCLDQRRWAESADAFDPCLRDFSFRFRESTTSILFANESSVWRKYEVVGQRHEGAPTSVIN
jgi:hypothetical protein